MGVGDHGYMLHVSIHQCMLEKINKTDNSCLCVKLISCFTYSVCVINIPFPVVVQELMWKWVLCDVEKVCIIVLCVSL